MPVVIAANVDEALIRSSAGRHKAAWMAGADLGLAKQISPNLLGVLTVAVDVTSWREQTELLTMTTTQARLSLLAEGHFGMGDDHFRFVVAAGPAATLATTTLNTLSALSSLQGGRAVLGLDVLVGKTGPAPSGDMDVHYAPHLTIGVHSGIFVHREGMDAELGLRAGWRF